jgi:hypothetical protein
LRANVYRLWRVVQGQRIQDNAVATGRSAHNVRSFGIVFTSFAVHNLLLIRSFIASFGL